MSHCTHHHQDSPPAYTAIIDWLGLDPSSTGLILTLFITGLASSFTHCIGMCGPIAITQMSMRLMHLPSNKMTQTQKLSAALAMPYYLGKSLTYVSLMLVAMTFTQNIKNIPYIRYIGIIFLSIVALLFINAAMTKTFQILKFQSVFKSKFDNVFLKRISKLHLHPFGFKGLLMGMVLGTIPCGIVYASIVAIISGSNNYFTAIIAMFMFGMATIPGLFFISYIGEKMIGKLKHVFNYLYTLMMFINAYLLLSHVFTLLALYQ